MHVIFIEGEHNDKTLAMCYNYIREKYIKEKVVEAYEGDPSNRDLCEGEYRRTS